MTDPKRDEGPGEIPTGRGDAPTLHESRAETEVAPGESRLPDEESGSRTEQFSDYVDSYATRGLPLEATQAMPPDATQAMPPGSFDSGPLPSHGPDGRPSSGGPGAAPGRSRYHAVRLHAKGGLGEIFLAVDDELNREVALKEIQDKHASRVESQFRFIFEAEVTGGLEHPGIVPVYGLGRYPDGRPYYAMRFIRGDTLKAASKQLHATWKDRPAALRHSLEFRQLLNRFVAVCQAIDYAHSRGVIHRDIKPENVMLGPHGETLVVDWGLAKALDRPDPPPDDPGPRPLRPLSGSDASMTLQGSVIGTPSFMSPEQAAGEIETLGPASDIFSLGSTLYDLLTGHAPFRGKGLTEVIASVRKAEFASPRALIPALPRALEAVCLKAMSLRIDDRYPTAGHLAADIERWLADEPVTAYREPPAVRAARWARRHRVAVAAGLALLLTSAAGLGITTVLIAREQRRTEENFQLARSAVEEMLTRVAEVDLADVPQMESVRRDLLERALAFYREFLNRRGNDSRSRLEIGRAYTRLGDIRELLGLYVQAEADYRKAIDLLEAVAAGHRADPEARRALARARAGLGVLLKKSNRSNEAEGLLRKAIADREALAAENPRDDADGRALAAARYQLGTLLARLKGRGAEDESAYRSAIEEQEALIARPASRPEARRELARYLNNLGILQSAAEPDAAAETFRRALKIQDGLEAESAGNAGFRWQRARTRNNLANLLARAGLADDAGPLYDQARAGLEALAADFPSVPDYRRERAMMLNNLGLLRQARPAEGQAPVDLFRRALDDQRRLAIEFPEVPDHRQKLAVTCTHLGDLLRAPSPVEAEGLLKEAVSLTSRLVADHPQVPEYLTANGRALTEEALLLSGQGRGTEALDRLASAIRALGQARRENPRDATNDRFLVEAHNDRAEVLLKLGRHADVAAEVARLAEVLPDRPELHLAAAKFLARCSELAGADPALARPRRAELADTHARGALKALRKAFEKGLGGGEKVLDDPAFSPLRGRDDFEKLRQDLRNGIGRAVV